MVMSPSPITSPFTLNTPHILFDSFVAFDNCVAFNDSTLSTTVPLCMSKMMPLIISPCLMMAHDHAVFDSFVAFNNGTAFNDSIPFDDCASVFVKDDAFGSFSHLMKNPLGASDIKETFTPQ